MGRTLLLSVGALALVACAAPTYVFRPEINATARVESVPAARYAIPPEAPSGDVRIASFGVTTIATPKAGDIHALHLRMIVANNGKGTWTITVHDQRIDLEDLGVVRAAYVSAPISEAPSLKVAPGTKRALDLFFPLPAGIAEAAEIPAFDVIWQIATETRLITERTPFERLLVVTDSYQDDVGGSFNANPYYPGHGYRIVPTTPRTSR